MTTHEKLRQLTLTSLFIALVVLFGMTPLGLIPVGTLNATILHIPVIIGVIALVRDLMALFGFQYRVVISTKPAKAIGSDEAWELATNALIKAVERANLSYTINAGDGAFLSLIHI